MKAQWLDRTLLAASSCYTLCLDEDDFFELLRDHHLPKADWPQFVCEDGKATTHFLYANEHHSQSAIVCLKLPLTGATGIALAALLVHEAVHIVQRTFKDLGEEFPSSELYAYSVQSISLHLMHSYAEQTTPQPAHVPE